MDRDIGSFNMGVMIGALIGAFVAVIIAGVCMQLSAPSIEKRAIAKYIQNPDEYQIVTNINANTDKKIIKINP